MFGIIFWCIIIGVLLVSAKKGKNRDCIEREDNLIKYNKHLNSNSIVGIDVSNGLYTDWTGKKRDVLSGNVAAEHYDFNSGEKFVKDKKGNVLRNLTEQEWLIKERCATGEDDIIFVDENKDAHYLRFNFVNGKIYKNLKTGQYCVLRRFHESKKNYYKRRDYNGAVYKNKDKQWEVCREKYEIFIDACDGHFVRFKDKSFVPESILPLELRIKEFNEAMDEKWLNKTDYLGRKVAGRLDDHFNVVEFQEVMK